MVFEQGNEHRQVGADTRTARTLVPSISQTEASQLCERYVARYFTADGRHDPSVTAQALSSVAEELGVPTVPDTADIYRTEPAEASAGVAGSEALGERARSRPDRADCGSE
jgi:hypothetical protein